MTKRTSWGWITGRPEFTVTCPPSLGATRGGYTLVMKIDGSAVSKQNRMLTRVCTECTPVGFILRCLSSLSLLTIRTPIHPSNLYNNPYNHRLVLFIHPSIHPSIHHQCSHPTILMFGLPLITFHLFILFQSANIFVRLGPLDQPHCVQRSWGLVTECEWRNQAADLLGDSIQPDLPGDDCSGANKLPGDQLHGRLALRSDRRWQVPRHDFGPGHVEGSDLRLLATGELQQGRLQFLAGKICS